MSVVHKKIIKGSSILKAMKMKSVEAREEVYEDMIKDRDEVLKKFEDGLSTQYASVPTYLLPIAEDGYKKQNTMLICMFVMAVKRLDLTLDKINKLFDVSYKSLAEAKFNMFEWCFEDLGFNCEEIKAGRRIIGYKITPNYKEINRLNS